MKGRTERCAVASFYYEINDSILEHRLVNRDGYECKYYVVHSSRHSDAMMAGGYKITKDSDRIWKEDSNGIRFVKNRYTIDWATVDLQEFIWIKLRAETL